MKGKEKEKWKEPQFSGTGNKKRFQIVCDNMTGIVCNACWQSFMPIQAMFEELRKASHCQELFPQRHIESKQEGIYRW